MFDREKKTIYYVSNVGTSTVSIIDGNNYHVIKEIEIGSRPQHIVVDEKNNVYIASDRRNQVTIIHDLYNSEKSFHIPNNGNIQVDSIAQRIYVSNTEEICIYSSITGEKIHSRKGFTAAGAIELDRDKRRLIVLDVLQNEIKIYETETLQLINLFKGVGKAPCNILLGVDEKYLYIGNKALKGGYKAGGISILNMVTGNISHINMPKGSVITDLEQSEIHVYAANSGLHQIEIIDVQKKQCVGMIKTTLPMVQRLRITPDKKTLLAISRSGDGKSVIDRIDASSNVVLDTFTFEEDNRLPYDIRVVVQVKHKTEEECFILTNTEDKWKKENGTTILAKEILSVYQEKIIFTEQPIEISSNEEIINIEEIVFQKCKVVNETMSKKNLPNKKDYSIVQYDFCIPYYIQAENEQAQKYTVNGKIQGSHKATLYIPNDAQQNGVQFAVNAFVKLLNSPIIIDNNVKFDVSILISTKVIVDKIVFVPFCKAGE